MVKLKQKQAICAWPKLSGLNDSMSFFLIEFFPARTTFLGREGWVAGKWEKKLPFIWAKISIFWQYFAPGIQSCILLR